MTYLAVLSKHMLQRYDDKTIYRSSSGAIRLELCKSDLYPFSVHVVIFNFYYQLMHLLIKNTFTVHI